MTNGTLDISPVRVILTLVGPLIEVSVMLFLVSSAMRLASRLFGVEPLPVVAGGAVTP